MTILTRIVIKADDGMYLTNGETYAKSITLGDWDKADNYHEITIDEVEQIEAEKQEELFGVGFVETITTNENTEDGVTQTPTLEESEET